MLLNGNVPDQTTVKPLPPSTTRKHLRTQVTQASQSGKGESFRFSQPPEMDESYMTEKRQGMKPHKNQISTRSEQATRSQAHLIRSTKNTCHKRHKDGSEESTTNSITLEKPEKQHTIQEVQRYATQQNSPNLGVDF
ncbi:hypothetical protein DY000_02003909 [Brassica cretica]|uniref:DUF4005 domain-containing protein n=1 Tax=Brassica cretica TaxID=69181 RepID=A0ABQ7CJW9_BRACR|nr:hypothetical protein DY000_02003909 [Brassica cretica]